jgi:hypothetical protein
MEENKDETNNNIRKGTKKYSEHIRRFMACIIQEVLVALGYYLVMEQTR